jgi:hypothetical protein
MDIGNAQTLSVSETQVVTLYDLDFNLAPGPLLTMLGSLKPDSYLGSLYESSYPWLMYRSRERPMSPPDTERYTFQGGSKPGERPGSILIHPQFGVGVLSQWSEQFDHSVSPLDLKLHREKVGESRSEVLRRLGLFDHTTQLEREYPFLAITIDTDITDMDRYAEKHAEDIGRLFTGGFDHEEPERLREYACDNISWRSYERLYLRWTDALGIYRESIDSCTRIRTIARAVQLLEICILVRTILRNASQEISELSTGLTTLTPPVISSSSRQANRLLAQFTTTELQYLVSPPVRSVEAERLIQEAAVRFGIIKLVGATRRNYENLDRRLQWIKAQWIAVAAVLTFVANLLVTLVK